MATAAAQLRPLLLAYLDLDGFKNINDDHGHEAGDRILRSFGAEGRVALRREDCFARLGGDEFAVLISLPSIDAAQEAAETLHARLSAVLASTGHDVTCSMGALVVPPDGTNSLEELMREADRLMYTVKKIGKNGVRFATHAPPLAAELALLAVFNETSAPFRGPIRPVSTLDTREMSGE